VESVVERVRKGRGEPRDCDVRVIRGKNVG
jgi:hypothetical protein